MRYAFMANLTMDKLVALAKNRGFVFPGSEIYGGLANTWDYGPLGVELKNNIKKVKRNADGQGFYVTKKMKFAYCEV